MLNETFSVIFKHRDPDLYFQVVAPINKLIETCPFDLICYSLDWHPSDHISFFENVANRTLDPSSAITDAGRTKVGDVVVFTGPPKTEQKLWPAHCIQESWGSEFHKDLIISLLKHTVTKSQIVSKNWILRKINKIVNLNFRAKN